MSCARTAEPIEMQFIWNTESTGSREHILHHSRGDVHVDASMETGTFGVSAGRLQSTVKHRILGVG